MYNNFKYYIVDKVSETIVATFFAKSEVMAARIMSNFDYDKAKLTPADIEVYRDPVTVPVFETYDEVINTIGHESCLFDHSQSLLDFDKVKVEDGE